MQTIDQFIRPNTFLTCMFQPVYWYLFVHFLVSIRYQRNSVSLVCHGKKGDSSLSWYDGHLSYHDGLGPNCPSYHERWIFYPTQTIPHLQYKLALPLQSFNTYMISRLSLANNKDMIFTIDAKQFFLATAVCHVMKDDQKYEEI